MPPRVWQCWLTEPACHSPQSNPQIGKCELPWDRPQHVLVWKHSPWTWVRWCTEMAAVCHLPARCSFKPRFEERCHTSSTAQGGGRSFKNRKPIWEIGCCESRMAERIHWWTGRCLRSPLFLSLALTIYLPTCLSSMYLSINLSIYISLSLSTYLSISLSLSLSSVYLSSCLPVYLSVYLSTCLSVVQCHSV